MADPATTIDRFAQALADLQAEHGPVVVAPPADDGRSPVALLLPAPVRFCIRCQRFRHAAQMAGPDRCSDCPPEPWPDVEAR